MVINAKPLNTFRTGIDQPEPMSFTGSKLELRYASVVGARSRITSSHG